MLTEEQRRAHFAFVENRFRRRQRNLRRVIEASGGWRQAALLTGRSETKLHQVADIDHPWHTTIGDKLARELEQAFHLRPGALDAKDF